MRVGYILECMEEKNNVTQRLNPQKEKSLLRKFPPHKGTSTLLIGSLLVVLLGVGSGWLLSGSSASSKSGSNSEAVPGAKNSSTQAGLEDEGAFPDSVDGVLEEGGIEGEGTYHLVREGGPSKYVYLTSTVIDLQSFVGKKVTVWGETLSGKQAGWLMDVGKIKVTD